MTKKLYVATFIDAPKEQCKHGLGEITWTEETAGDLLTLIFGYVINRIKIGVVDTDDFLDFIKKQHPECFSENIDCLSVLISSSQTSEKVLICESYFEFSNKQDDWSASLSWPLSLNQKAA